MPGEDRIVSRRCRYLWPPRSPDLTPARLLVRKVEILRVSYLETIKSVGIERCDPQRSILLFNWTHVLLCCCWIYHSFECLPGGGHVEHIL
ncbi:hypothetical protein TNCV_2955191 [Trichonephila clavipes]|nr:hypothetical protein TNCV_2955191 [Trichonephila clavipes]